MQGKLVLLLLSPFFLLYTAAALTDQELDGALSALRAHGYTLFPNAIATTELRFHLLTFASSATFTLFAPPDSALSPLDLAFTLSSYVHTLRLHISPLHLTLSDLRNLSPSGPPLSTLLSHRNLTVKTVEPHSVTVGGVRVSVPDLFLGSGIAVHGLEGILDVGFEDLNESPPLSRDLMPLGTEIMGYDRKSKFRGEQRRRTDVGNRVVHGRFAKFSRHSGYCITTVIHHEVNTRYCMEL